MEIPDTRIDDFIARWERAFRERLTRDEARLIAGQVLRLYQQLLRPSGDIRDVGDLPETPTPLPASPPQTAIEAV